jgi:hypothetical protein
MTASGASKAVTDEDLARVAWRISSRSDAAGGSCVEAGPFADGTGRVAVRHSHHRTDGPVIVYTRAEWDAFIAGVKANEFDFHL